jgi:cystathionine beta-lyase
MKFDFDRPIDRTNTDSQKFDGRQRYFGATDITPMWVADMDFAVPDCVTQAILKRASHPVYGYTLYPESLYQSLIDWFQRRHHWTIQRDWIMMMPGVVPSLHACCLALAEQGNGVIVQPPVYHPFLNIATNTHRRLLLNPLQNIGNRYQINFAELETLALQARILILCTPHNPVGRVWSRDELLEVLRIAERHQLIVVSDDIHADLVYPGHTHTMLGTLEKEFGDFIQTNLITAVAPSKTFNIPGLGLSSLIVPNPQHRGLLQKALELLHVSSSNPFSIVAYEAAYNDGAAWLDTLLSYLQNNKNLVREYFTQNIPQIPICDSEGTYLLWLDCRQLRMSDTQLRDFFIQKCKLGLSPGHIFGEGGSGFMRLNIGTQRAVVEEALNNIGREMRTP